MTDTRIDPEAAQRAEDAFSVALKKRPNLEITAFHRGLAVYVEATKQQNSVKAESGDAGNGVERHCETASAAQVTNPAQLGDARNIESPVNPCLFRGYHDDKCPHQPRK